MPIAAVPRYLGRDFSTASPGQRFGIFLTIWTSRQDQEEEVKRREARKSQEGFELQSVLKKQGMDAAIRFLRGKNLPGLWEKNDSGAREAWHQLAGLSRTDKAMMRALLRRQAGAAAGLTPEKLLRLEASAVAPFTTGLGIEHPLENGFAFFHPHGVPYYAGSGIKGVLRQAARELAGGEWGETSGWTKQCYYSVPTGSSEGNAEMGEGSEEIRLSVMDVLFGKESEEGERQHVRGALTFWDVFPQIEGDSLLEEIMTPHQSHYYSQKEEGAVSDELIPPHDSGSPNPISFLTVPPGSRFVFHVICDTDHLRRLTANRPPDSPDLLSEGPANWRCLLEAAFRHAFEWLGFGAKTAVGYGAMRWEQKTVTETATERYSVRSDAEPSVPSLSPEEAALEKLRRAFEQEKASGRKDAGGQTAQLRLGLLRKAAAWESEDARRKAAELITETLGWMDWPKHKREARNRELEALLADKRKTE
jgi:CRISPR-associated protein Cmr6